MGGCFCKENELEPTIEFHKSRIDSKSIKFESIAEEGHLIPKKALQSSSNNLKFKNLSFNDRFNNALPLFGSYLSNNFNDNLPKEIQSILVSKKVKEEQLQTSKNQLYNIKAILFQNGNIYEGGWNNNIKMEGKGRMYLYKHKICADGIFENGRFKKGIVYFINGAIYEGEINNSTFEGKGKLSLKDGMQYEGDFFHGQKHGEGKLTYLDGSYYIGHFENEAIEGNGKFHWINGYEYEGNFKENSIDGDGILKGPNKSNYKGKFYNNLFNGEGEYNWIDGDSYIGNYTKGKKDGKGLLKTNGISFNGCWKNNTPHGAAEIEYKNNKYQTYWRNGVCIEGPTLINGEDSHNEIGKKLTDPSIYIKNEDIDISQLKYIIYRKDNTDKDNQEINELLDKKNENTIVEAHPKKIFKPKKEIDFL